MIQLFVKSYLKDFQWLKQSMISVQKMCGEDVFWKIVVDDGEKSQLDDVFVQVVQATKRKLQAEVKETSSMWPEAMQIKNGYLRQQWIKMNAYRFMGDAIFWSWDSDLIAQKPFTSRDLIGPSGRPIYWFSQFNSLMGGSDDNAHNQRKAMIRDIFGIPDVSFEWMRCFPIALNGGILRHGESTSYWKKSLQMLVAGDARFSEFNVIGQFSHLYFPDAFEWRNTSNYPGQTFSGPLGDKNYIVSQGYSWGGCPEDVGRFVESL